MKDLLLIASPSTGVDGDSCDIISREASVYGESVRQILSTAWLICGDKSYEIAKQLHDRADQRKLPVALIEVESVLYEPDPSESGNHQ
jgi:hypothetical protein